MQAIQLIQHRGRLAAIVVCGRAIVSDRVTAADLPVVQGMCVYALEVEAGQRRGPYRDGDAEAHARALLNQGATARHRIRHRGRSCHRAPRGRAPG